jgi:hypothetical protein
MMTWNVVDGCSDSLIAPQDGRASRLFGPKDPSTTPAADERQALEREQLD